MKDGSERFSFLIVDDELQMRKLLDSLFSEADYNLLSASNGPEALRMASEARIDAALVDLVMPGMHFGNANYFGRPQSESLKMQLKTMTP